MSITTANTRLLGLVGSPVAHSRSPALWSRLLEAHGLDAAYLAFDVPPEALARALQGLHSVGARGVNVTVPHKRAALQLCETVHPGARITGAVNTLRPTASGWEGFNTDVWGVAWALTSFGMTLESVRALVLGTGGGARAVVTALAMNRARAITVVGRTPVQAWETLSPARTIHPDAELCATTYDSPTVAELVREATLVVQATSIGMGAAGPEAEAVIARPLESLRAGTVAFDLVYTPRTTTWLARAIDRGGKPVFGTAMLAAQATLALELWFGTRADPGMLRGFLDEAAREG